MRYCSFYTAPVFGVFSHFLIDHLVQPTSPVDEHGFQPGFPYEETAFDESPTQYTDRPPSYTTDSENVGLDDADSLHVLQVDANANSLPPAYTVNDDRDNDPLLSHRENTDINTSLVPSASPLPTNTE